MTKKDIHASVIIRNIAYRLYMHEFILRTRITNTPSNTNLYYDTVLNYIQEIDKCIYMYKLLQDNPVNDMCRASALFISDGKRHIKYALYTAYKFMDEVNNVIMKFYIITPKQYEICMALMNTRNQFSVFDDAGHIDIYIAN